MDDGIDWEDAFANAAHIPGGDGYPDQWRARAAEFRARWPGQAVRYGDGPRQSVELYAPAGRSRGLAVFVHGGYWRQTAPSDWSFLAEGALASGWTVALPGYDLAPAARIGGISAQIAHAVAVLAERVPGSIRLAGHSAGGHLVTRLVCSDSSLPPAVSARIAAVVTVSGLHDLRPLRHHSMNADLRLDAEEAAAESPALQPRLGTSQVTAWVGARERPEFLRQSALLCEAWNTATAPVPLVVEPGRHHFDVIDGLAEPDHPLCRLWCDNPSGTGTEIL